MIPSFPLESPGARTKHEIITAGTGYGWIYKEQFLRPTYMDPSGDIVYLLPIAFEMSQRSDLEDNQAPAERHPAAIMERQ